MTRHLCQRPTIRFALALACIASLSAGGHAGSLTFTYDWSPDIPSVSGSNGVNAVGFSDPAPITVTASSITTTGSSLSILKTTSDDFSGRGINLEVKITDGSNSGTLSFSGHFDGSVTNGVPNSLTATFNTPTQTLPLGPDTFTVSMLGLVSQDSLPWTGVINALISASAGDTSEPGNSPPPLATPEPSTLMLAATAAACLGTMAWRKARD
jgi:hypothetical protein